MNQLSDKIGQLKTRKLVVHYEGWFLFCPVWLEDVDDDGLAPIPKFRMWWLLDLATQIQQLVNWISSFFTDSDGCPCCEGGFWCVVKPLSTPRLITIRV